MAKEQIVTEPSAQEGEEPQKAEQQVEQPEKPEQEVTTPETEPVESEDLASVKAQLAALTRKHQQATDELKRFREHGLETKTILERLGRIETAFQETQAQQKSLEISNLVAGGDEEGARLVAERDIKARVKRLGVDLQNDPRLAQFRTIDDPIEARRVLDALEPLLRTEPAKAETPPTVEEPPKKGEETPPKEPAKPKGDLRITTQKPSGGDDVSGLSPLEKIRRGLTEQQEG